MQSGNLLLDSTEQARADIDKAGEWPEQIGGDVERFASVLEDTLLELITDISERIAQGYGLPPLNEEATAAFGLPTRVQFIQTGKKRARRSSAGLWRVLYTLLDADGNADDAAPRTLLIVGVRHAAAGPL